MANFYVTVTETLERVIKVEASNFQEAIEKVRKDYHEEKIVLDADDCTDVEFTAEDLLFVMD